MRKERFGIGRHQGEEIEHDYSICATTLSESNTLLDRKVVSFFVCNRGIQTDEWNDVSTRTPDARQRVSVGLAL